MRVTRTLAALVAGIVASIGFTVGGGPPGTGGAPGARRETRRRPLSRQVVAAGHRSVVLGRHLRPRHQRLLHPHRREDHRRRQPVHRPHRDEGRGHRTGHRRGHQVECSTVRAIPADTGEHQPNGAPNYIVAHLEDGGNPDGPYKYSIVGDPTRASGFLLSRDKVVSNSELRRLTKEIEKVGFNPCTFLVSPTTGGRSDYSPLCTI